MESSLHTLSRKIGTMKHVLLACCLILFVLNIGAQDIFISDKQSVRNDDAYYLVGRIDGKNLLFRDRVDSYILHAYDDEMNELFEKKVELQNKRGRILDVIPGDNDFTVIYRYFKRGKVTVYAQKVSTEGDTLMGATITTFNPRATNFMEVHRSQDKSKILVVDTDMGKRIFATTFDIEQFTPIWDRSFTPPDFSFERDFLDAKIDNQGNAYMILEKDNRKSKRNTTRFDVLYFNSRTLLDRYFKLSMKGKMWFDVEFQYDNLNQRLIAAGLFSSRKWGEANGFFYLTANPNAPEYYNLSFEDFDTRFLTTILGKEVKKDIGISEISIQDLILRRDGGVLMIAERNKSFSRRNASYNSFYTPDNPAGYQVDYHYNDVMLISAHPNGEIHWRELLRKRQFSQDDDAKYSSYFLMRGGNSLRFLYNDEVKSDTNVNEYLVLGTGQSKRKSLFNTEEKEVYLLFRYAIQISASEFLVPSERRGELRLVRFSYQGS